MCEFLQQTWLWRTPAGPTTPSSSISQLKRSPCVYGDIVRNLVSPIKRRPGSLYTYRPYHQPVPETEESLIQPTVQNKPPHPTPAAAAEAAPQSPYLYVSPSTPTSQCTVSLIYHDNSSHLACSVARLPCRGRAAASGPPTLPCPTFSPAQCTHLRPRVGVPRRRSRPLFA